MGSPASVRQCLAQQVAKTQILASLRLKFVRRNQGAILHRQWKENIMNFNIIKNQALSARINGLIKTAEKQREYYWNILFNCVNRCYEHNDVSWVNKGLAMSKAVGRYRATKAILQQVVPFKFDAKTQEFGGKRKQGMYEKLESKYGTVLLSLIESQHEADNKPAKAKDWEYEKARTNFMKACAKHDVDLDEVVVDIRDYVKSQAA
jgi:hypothetical protein